MGRFGWTVKETLDDHSLSELQMIMNAHVKRLNKENSKTNKTYNTEMKPYHNENRISPTSKDDMMTLASMGIPIEIVSDKNGKSGVD